MEIYVCGGVKKKKKVLLSVCPVPAVDILVSLLTPFALSIKTPVQLIKCQMSSQSPLQAVPLRRLRRVTGPGGWPLCHVTILRVSLPGEGEGVGKGETDPSICYGLFYSPFDYAASSGTLTARRGGEALWSLTEPTFRSIINLGASSVRRRPREKSNKFDTDTWRLYPHRPSVVGALHKDFHPWHTDNALASVGLNCYFSLIAHQRLGLHWIVFQRKQSWCVSQLRRSQESPKVREGRNVVVSHLW